MHRSTTWGSKSVQSTSRDKSTAFDECVSAPTLMALTPVAATALIVSRVV